MDQPTQELHIGKVGADVAASRRRGLRAGTGNRHGVGQARGTPTVRIAPVGAKTVADTLSAHGDGLGR
jgi:hypothetical protein